MNIERDEETIRVYDRALPMWVVMDYHDTMVSLLKECKVDVPTGVKLISPVAYRALKGNQCLVRSSSYSVLPSSMAAPSDVLEPFIFEGESIFEDYGMHWTLNKLASLTSYLMGLDGVREGATTTMADSGKLISYKNEFVSHTPIGILSRVFSTFPDGGVMSFRDSASGQSLGVRVRFDESQNVPITLSDPVRAQVEARLSEIDARLRALAGGQDAAFIEAETTVLYQTLSDVPAIAEMMKYINESAEGAGLKVKIMKPSEVPIEPKTDFNALMAVMFEGEIHATCAISRSSGLGILDSVKYMGRKTAEYEFKSDLVARTFVKNPIFYFGQKSDMQAINGLRVPISQFGLVKSIAAGNHPHCAMGRESFKVGGLQYGEICQGDWSRIKLPQLAEYIDGFKRVYLDSTFGNSSAQEVKYAFEQEIRRREK
jgi:hypothetical protein